jgi:hypothetical protein
MRKFMLILTLLLALMLACTQGSGGTPPVQPVGSTPGAEIPESQITVSVIEGSAQQPCPTCEAPPIPTDTPIPTPTPIPSEPISVRAGLNSLNSYSMVIEMKASDSTQTNETKTRMEIQSSQDQDAQIMHTIMVIPGEDGDEPSTSDSYVYSIGNDICSGSDADSWDFQTYTAQEKEMQDFLSEMVDILPIIDDPVYVGSETMNGIPSNHFTFQVSGLGSESGTAVNINQGDYWLAQDGQYIVRYNLIVETVDVNTQEVIHTEYLIDLTSINQPVSIAFPQGCLDAKANQ